MGFKNGGIPWNKGLTKETSMILAKRSDRLKGKYTDRVPWNKGLTKYNNLSLAIASANKMGHESWCKGLTNETDDRVAKRSENRKGKGTGFIAWNRGLTKEVSPILRIIADKVSIAMKGRTAETHPYLAEKAANRRGRTKENNEGVRNCALKLTGRTKEEYEYLAKKSAAQKGKTKENDITVALRAEKMKKYRGELSHCWIDGRSFVPYSKSFSKELKRQIRLRDDYTCQRCGIKEGEYKQALDSHHIDYNKLNCRHDNLISLCNSCNAIVNGFRPYWTWYFKERLRIVEEVNNITPNGQLKLCLVGVS